MKLLASRLEEVNAMALAGELPDVDISDKGVKITQLENGIPSVFLPLPVWFITCSPIRKLQKYWKKLTVGLVLHVTSRISKIITSGQKTEGCC